MEKGNAHRVKFIPGTRDEERMICQEIVDGVPCGLPAGDPVHTVIRKVTDKPPIRIRGIATPTKLG